MFGNVGTWLRHIIDVMVLGFSTCLMHGMVQVLVHDKIQVLIHDMVQVLVHG
jgi:hypothetical protein